MRRIDLKFVLADCGGDVEKAQRRLDTALESVRRVAIEECASAVEKSIDPNYSNHWRCGMITAAGKIRDLANRCGIKDASVERKNKTGTAQHESGSNSGGRIGG